MGEKKFFPLGNFIEPMAKIPATLIRNTIMNAGAGVPFGLKDVWSGMGKLKSTDEMTRLEGLSEYSRGLQEIARVAGSVGLAAYLVSSVDKKDLRTDKWGNHFVNLHGLWVNTEYFSFINAAAGGFMEMRTGKSHTALGKAQEYVEGAASGLKSLPGVDELAKVRDSITGGHLVQGAWRYTSDFLNSRVWPAAVRDLVKFSFKMPFVGPNTRPVDRLFFGAHGVESTQDVAEDKREQKQAAIERKREARNE